MSLTVSLMSINGQCHCGAIHFTALVDAAKVMACHCVDCQVFSGAPFRAVVPVPAKQVVMYGNPKIYIKVAQSGRRRAQAFCSDCGSQLYATDPDSPTILNLRLGCIKERAQLPPQAHIWGQSAMTWLGMPPFGPTSATDTHYPQPPIYSRGLDSPVLKAF